MTKRRTLATLLVLCLLLVLPGAARAAAPPPKDAGIPGVDTKNMTSNEKNSLRDMAEKLPSPCAKGQSLMTALKSDPKCKRAGIAIHAIQKWLMDGFLQSEAEEKYDARYGARRYDIDVAGAAVRGDPRAPVTLVEFSDFECPHCKMAEPVLKKLLEDNPQVKLVFLNFPLGLHPNAGPAAAAAVAAGKQGKFWAYHDKLFDNQGRLGPADLLQYAHDLHLDMGRFQADMEGAKARVARERAQGEAVQLTGTPTFFINGRRFADSPTYENLKSWIDEELAK